MKVPALKHMHGQNSRQYIQPAVHVVSVMEEVLTLLLSQVLMSHQDALSEPGHVHAACAQLQLASSAASGSFLPPHSLGWLASQQQVREHGILVSASQDQMTWNARLRQVAPHQLSQKCSRRYIIMKALPAIHEASGLPQLSLDLFQQAAIQWRPLTTMWAALIDIGQVVQEKVKMKSYKEMRNTRPVLAGRLLMSIGADGKGLYASRELSPWIDVPGDSHVAPLRTYTCRHKPHPILA